MTYPLPTRFFFTVVSNIDDTTNVQLWSPISSNITPRRHWRFRDIKTFARLMGRLTKEEKEVILRLLDMASSEGLLFSLIIHSLNLLIPSLLKPFMFICLIFYQSLLLH